MKVGLISLLKSRPTLVAQVVSAISSLVIAALLTRRLTPDDFGTYAAVMATYAMGVALIGTTIGTRVIEALSYEAGSKITLAWSRDGFTIMACALAAGATTLITHTSVPVFVFAASGMLGMIIDQMAGSYLLGRQRFWRYAGLVTIRMGVWIVLLGILVFELPTSDRLAGAFLATSLSALVPILYLAFSGAISLTWRSADSHRLPISAVGIANLALWLLASVDRLILARYALATLATYAALYGLLDRTFRGIANAEIQRRLPQAYSLHSRGLLRSGRLTRNELIGIVLIGVLSAAFGPWAIQLISGGNYDPPHWMSIMLSGAMVAMVCAVPSYVSLIARGRARLAAAAALIPAALNLVGNFALAPSFGTKSATVLTLAGYLLWLAGVLLADRNATRGDMLS